MVIVIVIDFNYFSLHYPSLHIAYTNGNVNEREISPYKIYLVFVFVFVFFLT
jgi:hypothetical protein